jgi:hypothetical protein
VKGPTSTVGCPKGHKSIDLVFCSVCGTPIGGPLVPEFGASVTAANAIEPDSGRGSGPTGPTGRSAARYLPGHGPPDADRGPGTGPGAGPPFGGPTTGQFPATGGPVPQLGGPNTGPVPQIGGPNTGPVPTIGGPTTGQFPATGGPNTGPVPAVGGPLHAAGNGTSSNGLAAHEAGASTGSAPAVDVAAAPTNGLGRYGDPLARPHSGPTGSVVRRGTPSGPLGGPGTGSGRGSGSPMGGPPPPARPSGGGVCPNCSAELDAGSRFCEVCGYDPTTGSLPQAPIVRPAIDPLRTPEPPPAPVTPPPPPPAQPGVPGAVRLVAVITADRPYYDSNHVSEVQFPLGVPPRAIELPAGPVSIGRRSRSRGTEPNIDLAGPPEDPAVSHTHASLLPSDDGRWELVDHGSTNGTYVNEEPQPVPANQPVPLSPGDRIYLGAWTRITLEIR